MFVNIFIQLAVSENIKKMGFLHNPASVKGNNNKNKQNVLETKGKKIKSVFLLDVSKLWNIN